MTKTDKATPRPWKTTSYPDGLGGTDKIIEAADGRKIADCFTAINETMVEKENAKLIVRAVNNFEALLEACSYSLAMFSAMKLLLNDAAIEALRPVKEKLEQAIANAE